MTMADIKDMTMDREIMNDLYNDLALLIKNTLVIFVEVQSTWSYGIIIRLLLYLALYYKRYIDEADLRLQTLPRKSVPRPEFYVVYTGGDHLDRNVITAEDFFESGDSTDLNIDLRAAVIHTEDKSSLPGQFITFCHVYNEQVRVSGRTKKALEETVHICKDDNIIKDFLTEKESEIMTLEDILFNPERDQRLALRDAKVQATIETYQECGRTFDATVDRIKTKFGFNDLVAEAFTREYWKSTDDEESMGSVASV